MATRVVRVGAQVALDAVGRGGRGRDAELGAEVEATDVVVQVPGDRVGGERGVDAVGRGDCEATRARVRDLGTLLQLQKMCIGVRNSFCRR